MKVTIVTHSIPTSIDDAFHSVYNNFDTAVKLAVEEITTLCTVNYETQNGTQDVEVVDRETPDQATVVRIVNPHNGYEYEALLIREVEVL